MYQLLLYIFLLTVIVLPGHSIDPVEKEKPSLRDLALVSPSERVSRLARLEMLVRFHLETNSKHGAEKLVGMLKTSALAIAKKGNDRAEERARTVTLKMVGEELAEKVKSIESSEDLPKKGWFAVFSRTTDKDRIGALLEKVEEKLIADDIEEAESLLVSAYAQIDALQQVEGDEAKDVASILETNAKKLEYIIKMIRFMERHSNNAVVLWPKGSKATWNDRLLALNMMEEVANATEANKPSPKEFCKKLISEGQKVFDKSDCARFLVASEHPQAIIYLEKLLQGKSAKIIQTHQDLFGLAATRFVPSEQLAVMYKKLGYDANGAVINEHYAERSQQLEIRGEWLHIMEKMSTFCPPFRNPGIVLPIRELLAIEEPGFLKIERVLWAAYYSDLPEIATAELAKLEAMAAQVGKSKEFGLIAQPLSTKIAAASKKHPPAGPDTIASWQQIVAALEKEEDVIVENMLEQSEMTFHATDLLKLRLLLELYRNYELFGSPLLRHNLSHNTYVVNALNNLKNGRTAALYQRTAARYQRTYSSVRDTVLRRKNPPNSEYIDLERMVLFFLSKHYNEARELAGKIMKASQDPLSSTYQYAAKIKSLCSLCRMKVQQLVNTKKASRILEAVDKAFGIEKYDRLPAKVQKVIAKGAKLRMAARATHWHPFEMKLSWAYVHECDNGNLKLPHDSVVVPKLAYEEIEAPAFTATGSTKEQKPSSESVVAVKCIESSPFDVIKKALTSLKKTKGVDLDKRSRLELDQTIEGFIHAIKTIMAENLIKLASK